MSSDLLAAIVAAARRSADERERRLDAAAFERTLAAAAPRAGIFTGALRAPGIRVIAECKRRSPAKGVLVDRYDPAALARAYDTNGAAAISVLTEPAFFDGSLDHLRAVRAAVTLPVLRKDFIVTPFQIREARAAGADAVLLIVAALAPPALAALLREAATCGLAALVEVHDAEEIDRALDAGAALIGVNSRNLRTLEVHVERFDELAALLPAPIVAVAESGLQSPNDVARLAAFRYDAFLIGERLVTAADPGAALRQLIEASSRVGA